MSMSRRKAEDEIWYVHAPLKNEKRPIVQAIQPSNIPYLNGVMDTEEELNRKPVMWFRDTDSEFIKLSKMGGREDLLIHRVKENSKEPKPYPIPAWWCDMLTEVVKDKPEEKDPYVFQVPAWFAHQDKNNDSNLNLNAKPDPIIRKTMIKHEAIEEPRRYGQLRNYMNPVKVKASQSQQKSDDYVYFRQNNNQSDTTMTKLIGNHYQQNRPKDYNEWKAQNLESFRDKTSKGNLALN
ncbi:unnamed protein product [Brachionus calyciflorus]|uniref:Uncharacterized protein n=1 Tax=Brachionus calyciflorus TaxID=104777 RepID=A0A813NPN0_9BILA|nr:unnamed protein product [Brachionus calyciflorus]